MSKGLKLGTAMIGALVATEAIGETKTPDVMSPAQIERVMTETGFMVPNADLGTAVFKPAGDGTFDVKLRVPEINTDGIAACDPVEHSRRGVSGVECSYSNWTPPEGFVARFANNTMDIKTFWGAFPDNLGFGGGGEVTYPIEAQAFLANPTLNTTIVDYTYQIYDACWEIPGDRVTQAMPHSRSDCRDAKGGLGIEIAKAEREAAQAENETAQNERRFYEKLLGALRG